MNSINTIEGLLFRSYLTGYNLSFLHKCIKANSDDYTTEQFRKACFASTDFQFQRNVSRAKELTERYLQYCERNRISIIAHFDKHYPQDLLSIKDFPPLLFIKGNLPEINFAAVVGTREVSPLALSKTECIIKTFADHNYGIISGLALGIDTLAHESAIKFNLPTVAVIPTSIDNIYPKENLHLADAIIEKGGAIISEQAPNYAPVANPFVLRNRIIAALSQYLIPVEMGKDSGTRHAVHYAVKYNKKVFLIKPGIDEINHYLEQYDGIIVSAKKYRKKLNVVVIKSLDDFAKQIISGEIQNQLDLL
jgi:DNA processing protein